MNIFSILIPKHTLTYLNANDPLDQAVAFLLGTTYTAIPVVDDQGRYVGIASEGDFLRAVMEHGRENLAKYKVADIVNKDEGAKVLNTVEKDEIMERILDRNFLCVVDDRDCFIGIITRKSIILYRRTDMYKYVFLDLDGTITEPEEGIINGVLYALSKFGITVEDRTTLYPYIGPPLRDSFREFHGLSEEEAEQAVLYYREYYSTKGIYQNGIMPGMEAAFQTLQERGCHLYVATSKPELYAKQILEHLKLDGYFDIIAGSTFDKSRDTKAAVIEYLLTNIAEEQKKPLVEDIIMVGDRKFDVLGAREFGIETLGVLFGYGSKEEFEACDCRYLAENAEEMVQIILR